MNIEKNNMKTFGEKKTSIISKNSTSNYIIQNDMTILVERKAAQNHFCGFSSEGPTGVEVKSL